MGRTAAKTEDAHRALEALSRAVSSFEGFGQAVPYLASNRVASSLGALTGQQSSVHRELARAAGQRELKIWKRGRVPVFRSPCRPPPPAFDPLPFFDKSTEDMYTTPSDFGQQPDVALRPPLRFASLQCLSQLDQRVHQGGRSCSWPVLRDTLPSYTAVRGVYNGKHCIFRGYRSDTDLSGPGSSSSLTSFPAGGESTVSVVIAAFSAWKVGGALVLDPTSLGQPWSMSSSKFGSRALALEVLTARSRSPSLPIRVLCSRMVLLMGTSDTSS